MFPMVMMAAGLLGTLVLVYVAFAGPSPAKAQVRRLESLRERHSKSTEIVAQAQLKKIMSGRPTKMDGVAQRFLPNPALLRKRIEQTGKPWSIGQYLIASVALAIVTATLITLRGAPIFLAIFVGLFVGIGLPHFVIGRLIKRRVAKFTARFPDAIELMVRGLRSGLPISETMGVVATERSEEHTSELQSLMRNSYAVFCLKKKTKQ